MTYTSYETKPGDTWDIIAHKMYGDAFLAPTIMAANHSVALESVLPAGLKLDIPVRTDPVTGSDLPPWKTDEGNIPDLPVGPGTDIPIITVPPTPLAFAATYPKVVGNKILFAINRTGVYTYSVERANGTVIASSPSYNFTAGFPVSTPDINDGGQFVVKVGPLVSGILTIGGTGVPLYFTTQPYYDTFQDNKFIRYAISKDGDFPVKLTRLPENTSPYDQILSHLPSILKSVPVVTPDQYKIDVGTLTATLNAFTVVLTDLPVWLLGVGVTYSPITRDCTLWVKYSEPLEGSIERDDASSISGTTTGGNPWVDRQFIPGETEFAAYGYNALYRFNPIAPNTSGVKQGELHKVTFRRISNRTDQYSFDFTPPLDQTFEPIVLDIGGVALVACSGSGPGFNSDITVSEFGGYTDLSFLLAASGVYQLDIRVWDDTDTEVWGVIVDMVNMSDPALPPIFSPTNVPHFQVTPALADGTYRLRMQGHSCSSTWKTSNPFNVGTVAVPDPPVVTGPITPKLETWGLPKHLTISIAGTSENWTFSLATTEPPASGYQWQIFVDGEMTKTSALPVNAPWQCNRPLWIMVTKPRIGLAGLWEYEFSGPGAINSWSDNNTFSLIIVVFNELPA